LLNVFQDIQLKTMSLEDMEKLLSSTVEFTKKLETDIYKKKWIDGELDHRFDIDYYFTGIKNSYKDEDEFGFYFINKDTNEEIKLMLQSEEEAFNHIKNEGWKYSWTDATGTRHFFRKLRKDTE